MTTRQLEVTAQAFTDRDMDWVNDVWLWHAKLLPDHTSTVECVMPAIGWQRAMNLLIELTVGPLGGNRENVRKAIFNARTRIAEALAMYCGHPALYGLGLVGEHFDVIPAWTTGQDKPGLLYKPLPIDGDFVHLLPERDGPFTIWRAQNVLALGECGSVLDEAEHWRFATSPAKDPR